MATNDPGRKDIKINAGAEFSKTFFFGEPGARKITDLVLTGGSTSATSDTAEFTLDDDGLVIATWDGTGIDDGTTMSYVSATEVALSAPATATLRNVHAVVRAIDASNYSTVGAWMVYDRKNDTAAMEFDVDETRNSVGVYVISATATQTAALTRNGVWDWKVTNPDNDPMFWVRGKVTVELPATKA